MSDIIESYGRGLKNIMFGSGDEADANHTARTERGNQLMQQLGYGGLAIGAGAGAGVALMNYLKSLREEEEVNDESRLNDDTLYIDSTKAAAEGGGVHPLLAPGLGVAAGIATGAGAYSLVTAVYNRLQKKRRQDMLDDAQNETLAAADLTMEKGAAQMSFMDLVTAFPVAVPILAAMATGGVTYTALNKAFPTVTAPKSKYPKRVRSVARTGEPEAPETEDEAGVVKSASAQAEEAYAEADCEAAASEFLLIMTDRMAGEKRAAVSITSDILHRVAAAGIDPVLGAYRDGGLDGLSESVKGASDTSAPLPDLVAAAATLCKSARLAPLVTSIAAAEYQDMVPAMYETAAAQGAETMEKMAGVASLMHLAFFRPMIKSATNESVMQSLRALLVDTAPASMGGPGQQALEAQAAPDAIIGEDAADNLNSDAGGALAEDAEGTAVAGAEGDVVDGNDDAIDQFLTEGTPGILGSAQ